MPSDDASVRIRLEGRLELLEAARSRYRLLQLKVLGKLRWKQAARQHATLLRELAEAQPAVDAALEVVQRLARAEGLKARSEAAHCATEVLRLRAAVTTKIRGLLKLEDDGQPLAQRLLALEHAAVHAPRLVLPGQRMATAVEVLPATLPGLKQVASFGAQLEQVFKRPDGLGGALPFLPGELEALEAAFPRGEAALAGAWGRVTAIDGAGTLTRYLGRLARRMPMHPPQNGAEQLLAAEFWKSYGLSRLEKLVAARVSPLTVRPGELFGLARWLWAAERDGRAQLEGSKTMDRPRAALFELAHALTAVAPGEDFSARRWDRLEALAATADEAPLDGDGEKLADNLRLLLRVLANERPRERSAPQDGSLVALVASLRAVAERA
jgi:hypothetical protein